MENKIIACFGIILVALAQANARHGVESQLIDHSIELSTTEGNSAISICDPCLKAAVEAGEALSYPHLFWEVNKLTSLVCDTVPSDTKANCLEKSESHIHQTRLFLQGLFEEENLCRSTGLCLDKSISPADDIYVSLEKFSPEREEQTCLSCRRAVKDLATKLKAPKMRAKIMKIILEFCEEADSEEQECKETVYKYVPQVLSKLDKLKTNELCRLLGFCDEGISL